MMLGVCCLLLFIDCGVFWCCSLLGVRCWSCVARCSLIVVRRLPFVVRCLLFVLCRLIFVVGVFGGCWLLAVRVYM